MDIKSAFLARDLDEVIYMAQPEGFEVEGGLVCKLCKSLYSLKQSPCHEYRFWHIESHFLTSLDTFWHVESRFLASLDTYHPFITRKYTSNHIFNTSLYSLTRSRQNHEHDTTTNTNTTRPRPRTRHEHEHEHASFLGLVLVALNLVLALSFPI